MEKTLEQLHKKQAITLIGVFVSLNLIDAFLTNWIISLGGGELNPFVDWSMSVFGNLYLAKILLMGIILVLLLRFGKVSFLKYVNVAMVVIVAYNCFALWVSL